MQKLTKADLRTKILLLDPNEKLGFNPKATKSVLEAKLEELEAQQEKATHTSESPTRNYVSETESRRYTIQPEGACVLDSKARSTGSRVRVVKVMRAFWENHCLTHDTLHEFKYREDAENYAAKPESWCTDCARIVIEKGREVPPMDAPEPND